MFFVLFFKGSFIYFTNTIMNVGVELFDKTICFHFFIVTGLSLWGAVASVGIVCMIYTALVS